MGYWTLFSLMCIVFLAGITALQVSDYSIMLIPAYAVDGETISECDNGSNCPIEFDTKGVESSLVQLDSDTYVVAYAGEGDDGTITIFTISADGSTVTECNNGASCPFVHETGKANESSLLQLDSDTFVLAYAGDSDVGIITTFTITGSTTTTYSITEVEEFEHDGSNGKK